MTTTNPSRRGWRPILFFVLILVAIGLFVVLIDYLDQGRIERSSGFWTAHVEGQERLIYSTRQREKEYIHSTRVNLRHVTVVYDRLISRDAVNGMTVANVALGKDDRSLILGIAGGLVWIWKNGDDGPDVEGRDVATLETRVNYQSIRQANPQLIELLPDDQKFVRVSALADALAIKTLDGRYFELELPSRKLIPLRKIVPPPPDYVGGIPLERWQAITGGNAEQTYEEEREFNNLRSDGAGELALTGETSLLTTSFLLQDTWYGLLVSNEEAYLGEPRSPVGETARQLYRVPVIRENGDVELDKTAAAPAGTERFLKGGFLRRYNADKRSSEAWHLDSPPSVLVLSRETLSETSPWRLSRLGLDGTVIWQIDTEIAVLEAVSSGDRAAVFGGYPHSEKFLNDRPYHVLHVNLEDGRTARHGLIDE